MVDRLYPFLSAVTGVLRNQWLDSIEMTGRVELEYAYALRAVSGFLIC